MGNSFRSALTAAVLALAASGCAPIGPGAGQPPAGSPYAAPGQTVGGQTGARAPIFGRLALPRATVQRPVLPAPTGAGIGVGPASSSPAARVQMPSAARMPQLRMPGFGRLGGGAPAGAPAGAQTQVTDPYAGQGVRQPAIEPPSGTVAPAATATVPVATVAQPPTAPAPQAAAASHTVVAGETAWSIARKYGVSIQALAAANGLPETMTVRLGQKLAIPAAGATRQVAVTAPGAGSPTPTPPSASSPLPRESTAPASRPAPRADAPDLGATRTAASGSGKLSMPVNGSIVRAYSKGKNEGIDIAAAAGTTVRAAGSGTVAAITRDTDGVPIVVVRHDGDLLTVYAGIDDLAVAKGDKVAKGDAIGKARASGRVHFEVRRGFESVDPEGYL